MCECVYQTYTTYKCIFLAVTVTVNVNLSVVVVVTQRVVTYPLNKIKQFQRQFYEKPCNAIIILSLLPKQNTICFGVLTLIVYLIKIEE